MSSIKVEYAHLGVTGEFLPCIGYATEIGCFNGADKHYKRVVQVGDWKTICVQHDWDGNWLNEECTKCGKSRTGC